MTDVVDRSLVHLRADLVAAGYSDRVLARLVRTGDLVRIRQGAYVDGQVWAGLSQIDRRRLVARAVLMRAGTEAVLSHDTAALEHGASGWHLDLERVHVTREDRLAGRREAGVVQHRGLPAAEDVVLVGDVLATSPARCVAEVVNRHGDAAGTALAHELVFRRVTSVEEIRTAVSRLTRWPGSLGAHRFLRLLPIPCESIAESRFIHLIQSAGLPLPTTQMSIYDEDGRLVGRVDGAWPEHGVFFEVDGRAKYDSGLASGRSPRDLLWDEKAREDEIRRITGWRCIRITWADLENPARLIRRLRAMLDHSAAA
ncbi:type IV toxin-antitoxin system AbiEi family antitoxin domain-containing protein [Nocardioides sp. TRM66260-LWL]|uniref:type IV toxin-antitoxin system AbiEi family antitoxin domain-containing protein n=1 Tax=Nocardioides sp. TRM66260-LWL TaxID=2874478 RepID=UPI001CC4D70E|nr:type IV toxin-antitoxin system AbiEi family antitoxin domain-containing protein [Nocardioides sp. TRM66260-LWL]MBZ5733896.1 type IV toxin-antitoxin system AbiEi family antitoxin domain-containing protein [Nocardioides sp. TRM66260-LWL]